MRTAFDAVAEVTRLARARDAHARHAEFASAHRAQRRIDEIVAAAAAGGDACLADAMDVVARAVKAPHKGGHSSFGPHDSGGDPVVLRAWEAVRAAALRTLGGVADPRGEAEAAALFDAWTVLVGSIAQRHDDDPANEAARCVLAWALFPADMERGGVAGREFLARAREVLASLTLAAGRAAAPMPDARVAAEGGCARCADPAEACAAHDVGTYAARWAFVHGAKWWEFVDAGGTMWGSDQAETWAEAARRYPKRSRATSAVPYALAALLRIVDDAQHYSFTGNVSADGQIVPDGAGHLVNAEALKVRIAAFVAGGPGALADEPDA